MQVSFPKLCLNFLLSIVCLMTCKEEWLDIMEAPLEMVKFV